jgi:hypothetical protein
MGKQEVHTKYQSQSYAKKQLWKIILKYILYEEVVKM